jgi:hypothetical protein
VNLPPLVLEGPCPEWTDFARRGHLSSRWGRLPVVVLLGPPEVSEEAVSRASRLAQPWVGRRDEGVVPLIGVRAVGDRVGWVYERPGGVAIHHFTAVDDVARPPSRVAAEIVGRTAAILRRIGPVHAGPDAMDVWIRPDGSVRLTGFTSPYPPPPSLRAPVEAGDEAGQVYRLGILLARLLAGMAPSAGTDRAHHETQLRRVAIRAMSRPGPPFPERLRDYLEAMLAWDADRRPPLSALADGLAEAVGTDAIGILAWAEDAIASQLSQLVGRMPLPDEAMVDEVVPARSPDLEPDAPGSLTVPGPDWQSPPDDDPTAESEPTGSWTDSTSAARRPREVGSVPVGVGPPAEVAAKGRPRLPRPLAPEKPGAAPARRPTPLPYLIAAAIALGCATLFAIYAAFLFLAAR